MTDKYTHLRTALQANPTSGPWKIDVELASRSGELLISYDAGERGRGIAIAETRPATGKEIANARYITACDPDTIGSLLQERDGLLAQHGRDSAELRSLCQSRDDAKGQEERYKAKYKAGRKLISELTGVLQEASNALAGGLWDYGPGQDEHDKCNEVIKRCQSAILEGLIFE